MDNIKTEHGNLKVFDDVNALVNDLSTQFIALCRKSVNDHGFFTVALSGGSTPKFLYQNLAMKPYRDEIPWNKVLFFWSDERCVAHDNLESNYLLAYQNLLSKVPVPSKNIFRTEGQEINPENSAAQYEETIKKKVPLKNGFPVFDLILLGLGPDGHTASLFPGSSALKETQKIVAANFVEKFDSWRLTFSYPALNQAQNVFFMVAGNEKAEVMTEIFKTGSTQSFPAQLVRPTNGNLEWYVDREAARLLNLSSFNLSRS